MTEFRSPHDGILDRQLVVTLFYDASANEKRELPVTPRELADLIRIQTAPEKVSLPWLKLAVFGESRTEKNSLRHDANVKAITGIEVDYDGGEITFEAAHELLEKQGIAAIVYTSPSHTENKPRWRVIAPVSQELPPDKRAHLVGRLNGLFRGALAPESFTLSQAYYFGSVNGNPAHRVEVIDGLPIDLHDDLDETWQGKSGTGGPAAGGQSTNSGAYGDRLNVEAEFEKLRTGENYHVAAVRLFGSFAAKGVGMVEALEIVRDAMRVVPEAQRDARWRQRYDDLPRCAEQIYGKNLGKGETRYQRPEGEQAHLDGFDLHEDGLAQAFTAKYRDVLRFCWDAGKWYRWTGNLWQRDRTKLAFSWARKVCRQLAHESGAGDKLKSILAKAATAAAVEKYAQAAAPHSVTSEIWDTDPFLLGTPGGTIDLRTGELREARREDYITKATAITPAATPDCDLWLRFLNEACGQDAGLIRFLQQFSGYLLTGDTREHALLFIYGPGGNGKSVWLNTVAGIQAALDYVRDGDTLLVTKPDRLARSTADLLAIVERLESKGVGLVVLSMGGQRIDTR
ncbi:MAG: recombinase family protein, partial [Acetobacteraceae bacterium]|nr:recombinase family protein [Acetobacteraceae bacterium]